MLLTNKIKESEECIASKALGFRTFLDSIREARLSAAPPRPASNSINLSEPLPDHDQPSEANHSELQYDRNDPDLTRSFNNNLSSGFVERAGEADKAIKNKLRVGVANRQRANCFRLPAYCFEPTKVELGDHLREVKKDAPKLVMEVRAHKEQLGELLERKGLSGEERARKISAFNPTLVLKYCTIHQISSASSLKDVLLFFSRLLELLSFSLPEPKVERYKNCVYFGHPIRKNQTYEGIVYYYSGVVYFGQLYNNQRNGLGVEIDIAQASISKGEFRDGDMVGSFQVHRDGEEYIGELSEGKYHGRGKLISGEQVFEGEFRAGRKVYGSTQRPDRSGLRESRQRERGRGTPYWSGQKELNSSRTDRFEYSNNKIRPIRVSMGSNAQLDSSRRKPGRKYIESRYGEDRERQYIEESRDFSYALNHEMESSFNPEISEMINSKRTPRVAMRIREVGKLQAKPRPQVEEDEERPLANKF